MGTCEYCGGKARLSPCYACRVMNEAREAVRWPYSSHPGLSKYLDGMPDSEWLAKGDRLQDLIVRVRVPWDSVFRTEGDE